MNTVILTTLLWFLSFPSLVFAGVLADMYSGVDGYVVIPPSIVYGPNSPFASQIPEITAFNHRDNPQVSMIVSFHEANGIAFVDGDSVNRSSPHDLYAPYLSLYRIFEKPATFANIPAGRSTNSLHDSAHHVSGIPGPRHVDLRDIERSKERMIQVLLKKEALASAWSAYWYLRTYTNWRNQNAMRPLGGRFEELNRGMFSMADVGPRETLDITLTFAQGRPLDTVALLRQTFSREHFDAVVAAGLPMLWDSEQFSRLTNTRFFAKTIFPMIAAYVGYFEKEAGHLTQIAYAKAISDFYYSPWYVNWADSFQIGTPLNELETSLELKMRDFAAGGTIADPVRPPAGTFELMYIRNVVAQFGRKLFEVEYLKQSNLQAMATIDLEQIKLLKTMARKLNNEILRVRGLNQAIGWSVIQAFAARADLLMSTATHTIRVDNLNTNNIHNFKTDPINQRRFWWDPMADLIRRPSELTSAVFDKSKISTIHTQLENRTEVIHGQSPDFSINCLSLIAP